MVGAVPGELPKRSVGHPRQLMRRKIEET